MRRPPKSKLTGVQALAWVFGILWLLAWLGGGVVLMVYEYVWPAVFCYAVSPVFLVVDIIMATRDD